jgi:Rhodopirellula transposase DDE domain
MSTIDEEAIRLRWGAVAERLDERGRQLFAAAEVRTAGRGGLAAVLKITGLVRSTVERGLKDLNAPPLAPGRTRLSGGGRRPLTEQDQTLLSDLKRLVEPVASADPAERPRSALMGPDKIAAALGEIGHPISPNSVRKLLRQIGVPLQAPCTSEDETHHHPRRNLQFDKISNMARPRRRPTVAHRHYHLINALYQRGWL